MRVLYHAINGVGLGHLMRLSAIAMALRERAPDVHQFIATSANYPPHLKRLTMPVMILPGDDGGPFTHPDRRARLVSSHFVGRLLTHVIEEYNPRVVVFDTHAPRRLVDKVLEEGRQAVLVYRRCREEFLLRTLRDGFLENFQLVLVPHSEAEFQAGLRRATVAQLQKLETVRYVGPIVYPGLANADAEREICRRYALSPSDEVIVVTGGAGGLGWLNHALVRNVCRAADKLRQGRPGLRVICVGGPYAQPFAVPEGCIFVDDEPCLQALIARAAAVIAIPGYNTVHEILQSGTRAALVPLQHKADDLESRVDALVQRGRARRLPLNASTEVYERCIEDLLEDPCPVPESFDGADHAADAILNSARAPRRYVCSRDPLARALATSFASPRSLARALANDAGASAIVRIDWDWVEKLFAVLDPSHWNAIAGIEIVLGRCEVPEGARRIRAVHEFLEATGFPHRELIFCVDDPSGGQLLAELTQQVRSLPFKALVARIVQDALQYDAKRVFESIQLCRSFMPQFKIDITLLDDSFAFVDQP